MTLDDVSSARSDSITRRVHAKRQYAVQSNDFLLRGPNYLSSMVGVLLRFRLKLIALSADIENVYYQVLVSKEDRHSFRFLYRPLGSTGLPLTYRMQVHIIGAISSPSTCISTLDRYALVNKTSFSKEAEGVVMSFYADNYLESLENEEEAIAVVFVIIILMQKIWKLLVGDSFQAGMATLEERHTIARQF